MSRAFPTQPLLPVPTSRCETTCSFRLRAAAEEADRSRATGDIAPTAGGGLTDWEYEDRSPRREARRDGMEAANER